jgi:phage/plasmid-like protein (TIGR03299 family)
MLMLSTTEKESIMDNLEIGSKGQVAFATRAVPAFEMNDVVTTTQMLDKAHLSNWDVTLEAVSGAFPSYHFVTEPYMVTRKNPFETGQVDVLATVGEKYKIVQNEDLFSFGDSILDGGGLWETAGSIKQGRVVFGSLSIDREVIVGAGEADDKTQIYLLVNTSHDGSVAVQASVTPVRVVCQNTLNLALSGVKQTFKMRHTTEVAGKMTAAREALGLTFAYADAFEAEANALYQVAVTKDQFDKIIEAAYPRPEKDVKGAVKRWETKRDTLMGIWSGSAEGPNTTEAITGTAWGALNTLTERIDWYRRPRGGNIDNLFAAASGFDPVTNVEKNRLKAVVKSFVGV